MKVTRRDWAQNRAKFSVINPSGQRFTYQIDVKRDDLGGEMRFVNYFNGPKSIYLGIFDLHHNSPDREGLLQLTKASPRDPISRKAAAVFSWVVHRILWTGDADLPSGYEVRNHRQSLPASASSARANPASSVCSVRRTSPRNP